MGKSNWYFTGQRDFSAVLHSVVLGAEERQAGRIAGMCSTHAVLNSPISTSLLAVSSIANNCDENNFS